MKNQIFDFSAGKTLKIHRFEFLRVAVTRHNSFKLRRSESLEWVRKESNFWFRWPHLAWKCPIIVSLEHTETCSSGSINFQRSVARWSFHGHVTISNGLRSSSCNERDRKSKRYLATVGRKFKTEVKSSTEGITGWKFTSSVPSIACSFTTETSTYARLLARWCKQLNYIYFQFTPFTVEPSAGNSTCPVS